MCLCACVCVCAYVHTCNHKMHSEVCVVSQVILWHCTLIYMILISATVSTLISLRTSPIPYSPTSLVFICNSNFCQIYSRTEISLLCINLHFLTTRCLFLDFRCSRYQFPVCHLAVYYVHGWLDILHFDIVIWRKKLLLFYFQPFPSVSFKCIYYTRYIAELFFVLFCFL